MAGLEGVELTIEKLVPGGDGFAHAPDGQALFVPGAAPGDRVRLGAVEKHRGALRAASFELVEPSPERVTPECPVAKSCGGCDAMHLSRPLELRQKAAMLKDALARVGQVQVEPALLEAEESGAGYRSRVRFQVGPQGKLGFFARGSHTLVEVPGCLVAHPQINQALATLRRLARRFPQALVGMLWVELRATEQGVIARFVPRDRVKPVAAEPLLRALASELKVAATEREAQALVERRQLDGDLFVEIPADAFSQINPVINRRLVKKVVEGATARGLTSFCDLFAGVGNFALPLARAGLSGVMVERTPSAVQAAERAAQAQGIKGLKTRTADAARALSDMIKEGKRFDLVVLDPPREGAPDVVSDLMGLSPRAVAYVACDPVTLSRDLKPLIAAGLKLKSAQPFDMFPRTHHFESLVWLEKA